MPATHFLLKAPASDFTDQGWKWEAGEPPGEPCAAIRASLGADHRQRGQPVLHPSYVLPTPTAETLLQPSPLPEVPSPPTSKLSTGSKLQEAFLGSSLRQSSGALVYALLSHTWYILQLYLLILNQCSSNQILTQPPLIIQPMAKTSLAQ